MEVERKFLFDVQDCLGHVADHLEFRDRMNAALHLQDVRYSPLTDEVLELLKRIAVLVSDPQGAKDANA
mgnify:CR=1 FL=1